MRRSSPAPKTWRGGGGVIWDVRCNTESTCHNCRMKICSKRLNSFDLVGGRMSTDCGEPKEAEGCYAIGGSSRVSPAVRLSAFAVSRAFKSRRARRPAKILFDCRHCISKKHFGPHNARTRARRPRFYAGDGGHIFLARVLRKGYHERPCVCNGWRRAITRPQSIHQTFM